jgi:hypothetical protein
MLARLTSAMLVSALLRRVSAEGGNAVIVARGDATAGSILLICLEKGARTALRERILGVDGRYGWAAVGPDAAADEVDVDSWLARRRSRDPDLWIVELDIPNAERFAAEMSGDD